MGFQPFKWNVVVLGHWNRGILTPKGVATRLFKVAEGTPLQVEVPIDGLGPYRIRQDDVSVLVVGRTLEIFAETPDFETLQHAREIACRAIEGLPETPLTATGYNIRYQSEEIPAGLAHASACKLDEILADKDYKISTRKIARALPFEACVINLDVCFDKDDSTTIELNFHRESQDKKDHLAWLRIPITKIEDEANKLRELIPDLET